MGLYTALILDLNLKKETPQELINIIEFLSLGLESKFNKTLDLKDFKTHPFFKCENWIHVGCNFSSPFDFPYNGESMMVVKNEDGTYNLKLLSVIKNYHGEFEKFLDLISKYVIKNREVYGYYMYEEWYTYSEIIVNDEKFELRNTDEESISDAFISLNW